MAPSDYTRWGGKVKQLWNQHVSGFWIDLDSFFRCFSQFFHTNFHHPAFWKYFYILTSFLVPISTACGCVANHGLHHRDLRFQDAALG